MFQKFQVLKDISRNILQIVDVLQYQQQDGLEQKLPLKQKYHDPLHHIPHGNNQHNLPHENQS